MGDKQEFEIIESLAAAGGEVAHPGATERLMEYWAHGAGAAKIKWGVPRDFYRCVSLLRKYFPLNPKGLCSNLHERALGVRPGMEDGGRGAHSLNDDGVWVLTASAAATVDTSKPMHWMAILAPINTPASDGRMFAPENEGDLTNRPLPLPLSYQDKSTPDGHAGSTVVGRIMGIDYTDNHVLGWGDLFDPADVPDVNKFVKLAQGGVVGASVDVGGSYTAQMAESDTGQQQIHFTKYTIGGATAVARPAFADQRFIIWNSNESDSMDHMDTYDPELDDSEIYPLLAAAWEECPDCADFAVLAGGWENMPVASREYRWSADGAVQRISAWADGDVTKYRQIFLWKDNQGSAEDLTSYKLPIADIIDDRPVLIYSAVYHAAAIVQGGHGGLPQVSEQDRAALRAVLTRIYAKISDALKVHIAAPWNRAPTRPSGPNLSLEDNVEDDVVMTAAVNHEGWSQLPIAPADTVWRSGAAIKALAEYGNVKGDNPSWQKYGAGFLWHASNPQAQGDFKLPIATIMDGKLTIVPRAVNAVASVLGGGRGGVDIPEADKAAISSVISALRKRIEGASSDMALVASAPLAPPKSWFEDPKLPGKTKIQVSPEGQVAGHLADWSTCHLGIQGRCVMAPKSHNDYADFHVGTIVTAEGDVLDVGNLTANTGHAPLNLTAGATKEHYDHTGSQVAVVRAGEDAFGIWVAGSLVPDVDIESTAALMRRSPLSGDWRSVDGKLSLVAALHVNRPGFQIRPGFAFDDEELVALQAAGVLADNVEDSFAYAMPGGGVITHTPQMSVEVSEDDDEVAKRRARLDGLINAPMRQRRLKELLEGK